MSHHPALAPGGTAVVTGAAGGIGLAAARRFAGLGMKLCLADIDAAALDRARDEVAALARGGAADVIAVVTDVSRLESVQALKDAAYAAFGAVAVLMNNAGTAPGGGPFDHYERWRRVIDVNLWGVINGVHAFMPAILAQGTPAAIINTGSKQGITCPPGDTAYNVSKAGIKVVTEALAHELRTAGDDRVTAHLLIPGFTYTAMTRPGGGDKPPGAWTADQVVDFMIPALADNVFYILCPDNDVSREVDEARILWAAGDIVDNRPPLSRWHPKYQPGFEAFLAARRRDKAGA